MSKQVLKEFKGNYRVREFSLEAVLTKKEIVLDTPIAYIITVPIAITMIIGDRSKDAFSLNRVKIIKAPKGEKLSTIYITTLTTSSDKLQIATFDDDIFSDIGVSDSVTLVDSLGIEYDARNVRGYDGSAWQNLEVNAHGNLKTVLLGPNDNLIAVMGAGTDGLDNGSDSLVTVGQQYEFNAISWDRMRSSHVRSAIGVSSNGAGTALNIITTPMSKHVMQVTRTAGTSPFRVDLEYSLDGSNWSVIDQLYTSNAIGILPIISAPTVYIRYNIIDIGSGNTITIRIYSIGR